MKWAIHVVKVDDLLKMAKLMLDKGAELLDMSYEYDVVTAQAKAKKMRKIVKKATRNGIEFEILDYKTYRYVRDRKPDYLSNCVAIFGGDGHHTINPLKTENGRKEKADGKTVSSVVGVGGKARDPEEDSVPVGEDRKVGSADVDVPVADTGRPSGAGEDTGYSQVEVPGSRVDKAFTTFVNEMVPPINTSEHPLKTENGRKEKADGKTVSSVVGVGGKARDPEEDSVPGGADEETGDVEVPVPAEPLDCLLNFEEYAKRYCIPIPTLRRWVKAGRLQQVTLVRDDLIPGYSMKYSMIKQGPLYPYKSDERRTTPWEWLPWEEYCRKRLDWASWTD